MLPFAVGARRRNVILDVGQEQGQRGEQQRQAPDSKEKRKDTPVRASDGNKRLL